jgi:hypothetical protein
MNLEIVSNGPAISWSVMMRHWMSGSLLGEVRVVASHSRDELAQVIPILPVKVVEKTASDEKKAA